MRYLFGLNREAPTHGKGPGRKRTIAFPQHGEEKRSSFEDSSSSSFNDDSDTGQHQQTKASTRRRTHQVHKSITFHPPQNQRMVKRLQELSEAIENSTRAMLSRHNNLIRIVERLRAEIEPASDSPLLDDTQSSSME